ncbi:MAG TPA: hypothetical protein DCM28_18610 [Phycisphaerales bacterium]|nr:hypothetical protein [Phycisphaerales bacterium]HCD31691.1 hypothetical protein [Phycisphaerales bacterium]
MIHARTHEPPLCPLTLAARPSRFLFLSILICCTITLASNTFASSIHIVSSASDVTTAMLTAQPGDVLVWTDGTYNDQAIGFYGANGTAEHPITLRAQTPGGVILTGNSKISIGGEYLIVSGFELSGPPTSTLSYSVQFREDSSNLARHCRLSNTRINNHDGPSGHKWIQIYGSNNRVDHCSFENKTKISQTMVIWLSGLASGEIPNHRIDHNAFLGHTSGGGANDWETIRIGTSSTVDVDAHCVISDNYFYQCDGELETISNKSNFNRYLRNTLEDCQGQLSLRHGNNCHVEGNFFSGTGDSYESGVRIHGKNHVVINNYFQNLGGTNGRGSIVLGEGQLNASSSGYVPVENAVVAFNTIVNCKVAFEIGYGIGSKDRTVPPSDSIFANNAVYGSLNDLIRYRDPAADDLTYQGNIMYHTSGSSALVQDKTISFASDEIDFVDPQLVFDSTANYYRPDSSTSPVLDAALGSYVQSDVDLTGRLRPWSSKDVGAEEISGAYTASPHAPRMASDVGVSWGTNAGPAPTDIPVGISGNIPELDASGLFNLATTGYAYAQSLGSTSGNGSITYSIVQGNLPPGLTLASDGEIFGHPSQAGVYPLTVQATDSDGDFDQHQLTLYVQDPQSSNHVQLTVNSITASSDDGNTPAESQDDSYNTRWAADGLGQWIEYALNAPAIMTKAKIAWHDGDLRQAYFTIQTSMDAIYWTTVLPNQTSSGTSSSMGSYYFDPIAAQYIRVIGHGNSLTTSTNTQISIVEFEVWGEDQFNQQTVAITGDSYIQGGSSAATNFGSSDYMVVKLQTSENYYRKSLVQADLPFASIAGTVTSAMLNLKVRQLNDPATHGLYAIDSNWLASTVNWNNQPTPSYLIASQSIPDAGQWTVWNITGHTAKQLATDTTLASVSCLIDSHTHNSFSRYHTSEASNSADRPSIDLNTNSSTILPATTRVYYETEFTPLTPWLIETNSSASSGYGVTATSTASSPPSDGHLVFPFSLTQAGTVKIWLRSLCPTGSSNSVWIRIPQNDGTFVAKHLPINSSWNWDDWTTLSLGAGNYTLEIAHRESNTQLDRVLITTDTSFQP